MGFTYKRIGGKTVAVPSEKPEAQRPLVLARCSASATAKQPSKSPKPFVRVETGKPQVSAAYQAGFECGKSPTGMCDQNPYHHGRRKEQSEWAKGYLDGGDIYLQQAPMPNS
jgi:hypothetical protein